MSIIKLSVLDVGVLWGGGHTFTAKDMFNVKS